MGKKYLIDSNALIDLTGGLLPKKSELELASIIDNGFNISFISKIEVLGPASADRQLEKFITFAELYTINDAIIQQTIQLRKRYKIKLPDAIIAATAITEGFILVTRNIKDFQNIPHIDLINPYDL